MKLLHLADVHVGASFRKLGAERGKQLREAVLEALKRVMDLAQNENVDAVLISGDLFDAPTISADIIRRVMRMLEALKPTPVFICPGNHDHSGKGSLWERLLQSNLVPSNAVVFVETKVECRKVKHGNLVIAGWACPDKDGIDHPLRQVMEQLQIPQGDFLVALLHGSLRFGGVSEPDFPIERDEIARSPFHYLALGHWHKWLTQRVDGKVAVYPGALEYLSFAPPDGKGKVALVEWDGKQVKVTPKEIGAYEEVVWSMTAKDIKDIDGGASAIIKRFPDAEHKLLTVRLWGIFEPEQLQKIHEWCSEGGELAQAFFWVELDDRQALQHMDWGELLRRYPASTFAGQLVRMAKERYDAASNEDEKRIWLEAAIYGLNRMQAMRGEGDGEQSGD
ncbi:DNA repair exonuclease SbcCD nuclease subunit [Candidatus Fervidibacteria bacterium JGI MDM2 JNZ-1-D12]